MVSCSATWLDTDMLITWRWSISVLLIGLRWHSQTSPWWGALSAIGPPRDDTALALLICCSANDALLCRNYHVFYYLLAGASEEERKSFHLLKPEEYHYLNQVHQPKQTTFTSSSVTPASVYAARRDVISIVVVLYVRNFSCFCVLSNPDCYKSSAWTWKMSAEINDRWATSKYHKFLTCGTHASVSSCVGSRCVWIPAPSSCGSARPPLFSSFGSFLKKKKINLFFFFSTLTR